MAFRHRTDDALHIAPVERNSPALRHPSLPCLAEHFTINLTAGCPHECCYCYAQSFAQHPGWGEVRFYANSLELLRGELARRRRLPQLVFFSTACEPFVPDDAVLSCPYDVMELLIAHGVFLLVSTKRAVPGPFLDLFARRPELVHVQVGLTTLDDGIRRLLEPRAPSVDERLRGLGELIAHGVPAEVRADPLVPGLTDSADSFARLCRAARRCGATRAVTSHLFLRRANRHMLNLRYGTWSARDMGRRLYTHRYDGFCGGGPIWLPPPDYRRRVLSGLRSVAARHGVRVRLCSCTNRGITTDVCHPAVPDAVACRQERLF